jgi:oligopeptidase A
MLTKVNEPALSGIHGVEWDAVELPSQLMENFCWHPEVVRMISSHYLTGYSLPAELLEQMISAKNFQSAMQMIRQLEFSLFDFLIHMECGHSDAKDFTKVLERVREEVSVLKPPAYNRFPQSFGHIFSGGYAAGYYSYKWAEVLSADAFSKFEEHGTLVREIGEEFKKVFLERGGSQDAMDLFLEFRGRVPSVEPLLRHSGLLN